jgi:hypothetical protein
VNKEEVVQGVRELRELVQLTHWIQGSYLSVQYEEGDGDYADGAIVDGGKVVGCLVGLARLVGAKTPSYSWAGPPVEEGYPLPAKTKLAEAIESAMLLTIREEFADGFYENEEDVEFDEDGEPHASIEGWNDAGGRTREEIDAMLARTIERLTTERLR